MIIFKKKFSIILFIALICMFNNALAYVTEVITLNHQSANRVEPIVKKLLENGDSVSIINNQIILKVKKENLDNIKKVISSIDVPSKMLLISIFEGEDPDNQNKSYSTRNKDNYQYLRSVKVQSGYSVHVSYDKAVPIVVSARGFTDSWKQTEYHQVSNLATKATVKSQLEENNFQITQQQEKMDERLTELRRLGINPEDDPYENDPNNSSYSQLEDQLDVYKQTNAKLQAQYDTLNEETKFDKSKEIDANANSGSFFKEYKVLSNGVTLKPVLIGDKVELTVIKVANDEKNEILSANNLQTNLVVPLNEWINVVDENGTSSGGVSGNNNSNNNDDNSSIKSYSTIKTKKNSNFLWVKIEEL